MSASSRYGRGGFAVPDCRINPNVAPVASLTRLPGIGPARAGAIVDYRREVMEAGAKRAFTSCEDLERVRGIGPVTAGKISKWLKYE
jgi:competence protein ComEA